MTRKPEDLPVPHTRCCGLRGLRPDKLWPCAKPDTADKNGIPEAILCFGDFFMMASQKLTNCCVAAIALVTAA
jgi:hypothetical protein